MRFKLLLATVASRWTGFSLYASILLTTADLINNRPILMALPGTANRRDGERLVTKFCACLRDNVRIEPQRRVTTSSSNLDGYSNGGANSDLPWLCIRFDDELTRQVDSRWRRVREKLEAVSILSAVACCRAYSLQNNPQFWRQFLEARCGVRSTEAFVKCLERNGCGITARRTKMPMFLLDFSFMDVTPDLLRLCRSFLTARRKAKKCMRISYVEAMTQLEAIAKQQQRGYDLQPEKIQIGFILNWCGLQTPEPKSQTGDAPAGFTQASAVQLLQEIIGDIATRAATIERLQASSSPRSLTQQQQRQSDAKMLDVDPTAWGFFYFEVSVLDMNATELVKKDFARIAQMVADPSGRLRELVLNKIISNASEQQYTSLFGTLMSECFAVEIDTSDHPEPEAEAQAQAQASSDQSAPPSPAKRVFLERFAFDWNALNLNRLSSLFSAIHCSSRAHQSVRDLSLIGSFRRFDGDPTLPWAWLTYGVFHPSSSSRIQSLDLSSNTLCHDDVNAMRRVLTVESYREELLGLEVLYSEKNRVIGAAAGAITTQPYSAARLKKQANLWPTSNTSDKVLLQLNDESAWFEVFQHGTRWTCVLIPGYGVLWTRTKMVLKIEQRERQLSNIRRTPLKQLMLNSMVGKEIERINHVFRELLPLVGDLLVHLELRSNPLSNITLAAIMSSCPNLNFLDISACGLQTIAAIMDSYERGQCRVSTLLLAENHIHEREVRRLCALLLRNPADVTNSAAANLRCLDVDQNPIGRPGLLAIGKVLASNRMLQSVVLSRSEDPDGQLRGRFAIHEDEFLGVAPLQLHQRFATLSAARVIPAMNAVDIPVMKAVFAFAGAYVYRKVVWK